jgi:hypothetical protein
MPFRFLRLFRRPQAQRGGYRLLMLLNLFLLLAGMQGLSQTGIPEAGSHS